MSLGEPLIMPTKTQDRTPLFSTPQTAVESSGVFERVAVPLGNYRHDDHLLRMAREIAAAFHSEFQLQCVAQTPINDSLHETVQALLNAGAVAVHSYNLTGSPDVRGGFSPTLLLHLADPSENSSAAWFGTPTQRILRRASVPTLVVKPDISLKRKSLLCVFDFSDSSLTALRQGVHLARVWNTRLQVLHVTPPPQLAPVQEGSLWRALSEAAVTTKAPSDSLRLLALTEPTSRQAAAQRELELIMEKLDTRDVRVQTVVVAGDTAAEALAESRRKQCGLLLAARGPRSGVLGVEVQTPAEALAEVADIPVLVFPAR